MAHLKDNYPDIEFIEIWECEFQDQKSNCEDLQHFLNTVCNISESINPRDSLFGGRTNAIKMYHKVSPGEKINYVDFRSLYPDRQKYGIYPLGHPEIITENFKNVEEYFGLIKCRILPPKGLFLPVLPVRIKGKLFFPLCNLCASEDHQKCNHNDKQRTIEGTWVSLEILEALKQGYKIITIFEVWHYPLSTQYDPITKKGGLFTTYVNLFLKFKEEASGYPDNVNTKAEKEEYINKFFEKEGIWLNRDNIKHNPGIRSVMKLMLNSFWGRFGMQTNKTQVKYITKLVDWYALIEDDRFIIQDISMVIPDVLIVYYSQNSKSNDGGNSVNQINVVIASFVTCQARLKLLEVMQKLGKRVIYHDTDSVIYSAIPGDWEPKLGDHLGDLTNEIAKADGSHIVEIVCGGPKNYAYITDSGASKCVVKGFSLSVTTNLKLNFESIKDIVCGDRTARISVDQLKFKRCKNDWSINTSVIKKLYSFVYDKRVMIDNYETIPFGF